MIAEREILCCTVTSGNVLAKRGMREEEDGGMEMPYKRKWKHQFRVQKQCHSYVKNLTSIVIVKSIKPPLEKT